MLIIGIDPGISGSICFFEDGKILDVLPPQKFVIFEGSLLHTTKIKCSYFFENVSFVHSICYHEMIKDFAFGGF